MSDLRKIRKNAPRGKPFAKGNPGKPKGTVHTSTRLIKEAVMIAFTDIGGAENLARWARENETDFYTKLAPKLIPHEMVGADDGPISIEMIRRIIVDPKADA